MTQFIFAKTILFHPTLIIESHSGNCAVQLGTAGPARLADSLTRRPGTPSTDP